MKRTESTLSVEKYLLRLQDQESEGKISTDPAENLQIEINLEDFEKAIASLSPSVSEAELAHYQSIQSQFQSEPKGKDKGKQKAKEKGKTKD